MSTRQCTRCFQFDSSPLKFLLTCADCRKHWHHRCHQPPVSDEELMARIRAFNKNDIDNGIYGWTCRRCRKKRSQPQPPPPPPQLPEITNAVTSLEISQAPEAILTDAVDPPESSSKGIAEAEVPQTPVSNESLTVTRDPQGDIGRVSTSSIPTEEFRVTVEVNIPDTLGKIKPGTAPAAHFGLAPQCLLVFKQIDPWSCNTVKRPRKPQLATRLDAAKLATPGQSSPFNFTLHDLRKR